MIPKIKIVTDSACDITKEEEAAYQIEVLSFPIAVEDKNYMERVDLTNEEFYRILENCTSIPATAQITHIRFEELYERVWKEGYTDLIYVAINSTGSNTYNNSLMARDNFRRIPRQKRAFIFIPSIPRPTPSPMAILSSRRRSRLQREQARRISLPI